jgi:hypothetical protein
VQAVDPAQPRAGIRHQRDRLLQQLLAAVLDQLPGAVGGRQDRCGRAGRVQQLKRLVDAGQIEQACAGQHHRALREGCQRLVRRGDHGIGATGDGMRRQRRVEAEVCAPGLVDDQRHGSPVRDGGDRLQVGQHAHVAGLDQEYRPQIRVVAQRAGHRGGRHLRGQSRFRVDLRPHPDRLQTGQHQPAEHRLV